MNPPQTTPSSVAATPIITEPPLRTGAWQQIFPGDASLSLSDSMPQAFGQEFAGAVVGTLVGMAEERGPVVDFPGNASGDCVPARSCVPVASLRTGMKLVLVFEQADPEKPVIIGVLQESGTQAATDSLPVDGKKSESPQSLSIEVDGERLVYAAQKEIVLRCGKASIQLLADGSVRTRGTELLSRASGTNRIRGGNVQIN